MSGEDRKVKVKFEVAKNQKKARLTVSCKDVLTFDDIRDVIDQLESVAAESDEDSSKNH